MDIAARAALPRAAVGKERRPPFLGVLLASQGGDRPVHHAPDRGLIKMARLPPVAAAIPIHRTRIVGPDHPPRHHAYAGTIGLMLRVETVIWPAVRL